MPSRGARRGARDRHCRHCGMCPWRWQWDLGSGFENPVPGQSSPFGGAYRFRRPPEAYEIALEPGMAPEHRVRLQSNERNFLSPFLKI